MGRCFYNWTFIPYAMYALSGVLIAYMGRAADDHKAGDEYIPADRLVLMFHVFPH